MRNVIFTIYYSPNSVIKITDLYLHNLKIEPLLVKNVQGLLNNNLKIKKIMLFLSAEIDCDNINGFIQNFYEKKPLLGIISMDISIKNLNWDMLNESQKTSFLIGKWRLLFSSLSENYFSNSKIEVLKYFNTLIE